MASMEGSAADRKLVERYRQRTLDESLPELRAYLHFGARVLDVGCGPGALTLDVAEAVAPGEVVGIDPAADRIAIASEEARRRNIGNATFEVGDAHTLAMPDDSFDVVYSNTVLQSLIDPVKALREQRRVAKEGGWVIAAGVRDWGFSPRYPPCPSVDAVWEAYRRHCDSLRSRYQAGEVVTKPRDRKVPELTYLDIHAGRKCSEWFTEAGLTDLSMQIRVGRWRHAGSEDTAPLMLDLIPDPDDPDDPLLEMQGEIFAEGLLDEETVERARQELAAWYGNPRAFYCWALLFVAGRA